MKQVGAFEAKSKVSALLDLVEQGEQVLITRRGRPVAKLISPTQAQGFDRDQARAAVERINARRKGVTLGGLKIKDLINEGRK
jgi:prevent-host-death family protein